MPTLTHNSNSINTTDLITETKSLPLQTSTNETNEFDKVITTININPEYETFILESKRVTKAFRNLYIPYQITFKSQPAKGGCFLCLASLKDVIKDTFRQLEILYFHNKEKRGLSLVKYTFPGFGVDGKYLPHYHSLIYLPKNRNLILALEAIYRSKFNDYAQANKLEAVPDIWNRYYSGDITDFFDYAGRREGESEENLEKLELDLSNFNGYKQIARGYAVTSSSGEIDLNLLLPYHQDAYNSFGERLRNRINPLGFGLNVEELLLPPDISSKIKREINYIFPSPHLDIVRDQLEVLFPQVYFSDDKNIHLISAKPGVGKSTILETLSELIKLKKYDRILLCHMTHPAMDSVKVGHKYPKKPEILEKEDKIIREQGLSPKQYYQELAVQKPNDPRVIEYRKYKAKVNDALNKHKILKISHARFFSHFSREDMDSFDLIIFDECIIKSRFKTESIAIHDIELLVQEFRLLDIDDAKTKLLQSFYDRVSKTKEGRIGKIPTLSKKLRQYIEKLIEYSQELKIYDFLNGKSSNTEYLSQLIIPLLESKFYARVGMNIEFIKPFEFPDKKIIILSGTASKTTYSQLFGEKFIYHELPTPHKLATIRQISDYSFSKRSIANDDRRYRRVIDHYKNLGYKIISLKNSENDLNLGNTESRNELKGENICIPGTLNPAVTYIRLLAANLGLDYKSIKNYSECKTKTHIYKGMIFPYIALSENLIIRDLQFDFTSSALEQAVARGRGYECELDIVVFSNFPCLEAEFYVDDELLVNL
ncbi:hypothetical protein EHR04_02340 [Leptospira levettii]|uniref:hypothetical protein n=1 Tax=Leptospira levettii TaxID=2023178 RepID=UPI001091BF00|nr:hypothetical protein [Leptospira levettii]TGM78619.1 hypothetical protein EHR04_02340 [Leptospira levettii]